MSHFQDFICLLDSDDRASPLERPTLLCFVIGCDCQLIIKENYDDDDDGELLASYCFITR